MTEQERVIAIEKLIELEKELCIINNTDVQFFVSALSLADRANDLKIRINKIKSMLVSDMLESINKACSTESSKETNQSDEELRERCLNKAIEAKGSKKALQRESDYKDELFTLANSFFSYIKKGNKRNYFWLDRGDIISDLVSLYSYSRL